MRHGRSGERTARGSDDTALSSSLPSAQGRDVSATIDSALLGSSGFQNDGDNELTGIHVSDGDPTPHGLLGAKRPTPFKNAWRVFYTQQHGDNVVWELLPRRSGREHDED